MHFTKNASLISMIAWRSLWKNRRRTALTLLTIMVGTGMIIFMRAIQDGGFAKMAEDIISLNSGHIQIHDSGFWEDQSIDKAFIPPVTLISLLRNDTRIAAFTRRIHAAGIIFSGAKSEGVLIQAVEPDREKKLSSFHRCIEEGGRYFSGKDRNAAVIGSVLAKNMGLKVGDTVSILSQAYDGSIAAENLTIIGLCTTGSPDLDKGLLLMPLPLADDTFGMMGRVNSIVVRLKDTDFTEPVLASIKSVYRDNTLEVIPWDVLNREVVQLIVIKKSSAWIFYMILLTIVSFGVLNTIQMSVFERTREFGIMLAIGTSPRQITLMVIMESIYISLIGIGLGICIGGALGIYFHVHPLDYSGYAGQMQLFNVNTYSFPAILKARNIVETSLLVFIFAHLFTLSPALQAARLKPLEAIRQL